ncbi:C-GCAxxG-C-C family protein [uncultured Ruminococcus sp.]|uniref:C-GCAxxG-C-C family protein n=1 Tax=uncultured Ruminococcus sp. TaxID=165186 RepID=UPI00292FC048|nr:C-GCAxxG-C-C family protein [uncultured Ruminococcus sp.]
MNRPERGAELKRSHNCCQAVLLAFEDLLPYDKESLLMLGSTFGSGMGGMMGTCGALVGAEMVLGILSGRTSGMNGNSRRLFQAFEEKCGASRCIDLKGVLTGNMLCSCEDCVKHAIELVEEQL